MADLGHQVILTSRDEEKGEAAVKKLKRNNVHYHKLDVTRQDSVDQLKQYVTQEFTRLDMLVNNAGINYDTWQNASDADLDNIRETLETNLLGAWRCAKAFIPMMKRHKYGRIVNVSSGAGAISGMSGGVPGYAVSKAALNVLTIKLAAELRNTGMLVNAVCPGWVRTNMGGMAAPRSVTQGAKGIVWAATLPDDGPSGGFFRDGKAIDW